MGVYGTRGDKTKSMAAYERHMGTRWVEIIVHGLALAPIIVHGRLRVYHGRTCVPWVPTGAHG